MRLPPEGTNAGNREAYANRVRNGRGAAIAYPVGVCDSSDHRFRARTVRGALKHQLSGSEAVSILSTADAHGPRDGSTEAGAT